VTQVLPTDMVTYNEVDLVRRVDRIFISPDDARLAPGTPDYATFMRHIDEHPVIAHNARIPDPVPRKISVLRSHVVQAYRHGLSIERVRAGLHFDRDARAAASGLTQREVEVLHWVAGGQSNDDVARIIGATSATVKKHLEHIYDTLGVANRTAASALYNRKLD
jgi:DNA-binding CsgD family transcriptional regulator